MNYSVTAGKTSHILPVYLLDSSSDTGAGLGGVTQASITGFYWRSSASATTTITFAGTPVVGTYVASTFVQVHASGLYQLCLPDAAYASGADYLTVSLSGATNMVPVMFTVPIKLFNQDVAGVTVAPNGIAATSIQDEALTGAKFAPDGTAQGGSTTSIILSPTSSGTNDYYQYQVVAVTAGTGAQQSRLIIGYNGGTKVATVDRPWATIPDGTSEYVISAQGPTYTNIVSSAASDVIRDAIKNLVVESQGTITFQQAMSIALSALAGRSSNGNTTFSTPNNAATRIVASVDSGNNRTSITLTPSA